MCRSDSNVPSPLGERVRVRGIFEHLKFEFWNLSFDLAQDGELAEPFCNLDFEICHFLLEVLWKTNL
jgi:hypothetical protein